MFITSYGKKASEERCQPSILQYPSMTFYNPRIGKECLCFTYIVFTIINQQIVVTRNISVKIAVYDIYQSICIISIGYHFLNENFIHSPRLSLHFLG